MAHTVSVVDGVIFAIGGFHLLLNGPHVLAVESYNTGVRSLSVSLRGKAHTFWGDLKTH